MAVPVEFLTIIIPIQILEDKYQGGLEQYKADVPNGSYVEDEYLTRVSFMSNIGLDKHCTNIISKGLQFDDNTNSSDDFVIAQLLQGLMWDCNWIEVSDAGYASFIRELE